MMNSSEYAKVSPNTQVSKTQGMQYHKEGFVFWPIVPVTLKQHTLVVSKAFAGLVHLMLWVACCFFAWSASKKFTDNDFTMRATGYLASVATWTTTFTVGLAGLLFVVNLMFLGGCDSATKIPYADPYVELCMFFAGAAANLASFSIFVALMTYVQGLILWSLYEKKMSVAVDNWSPLFHVNATNEIEEDIEDAIYHGTIALALGLVAMMWLRHNLMSLPIMKTNYCVTVITE